MKYNKGDAVIIMGKRAEIITAHEKDGDSIYTVRFDDMPKLEIEVYDGDIDKKAKF